jgi:hypothetical protein
LPHLQNKTDFKKKGIFVKKKKKKKSSFIHKTFKRGFRSLRFSIITLKTVLIASWIPAKVSKPLNNSFYLQTFGYKKLYKNIYQNYDNLIQNKHNWWSGIKCLIFSQLFLFFTDTYFDTNVLHSLCLYKRWFKTFDGYI